MRLVHVPSHLVQHRVDPGGMPRRANLWRRTTAIFERSSEASRPAARRRLSCCMYFWSRLLQPDAMVMLMVERDHGSASKSRAQRHSQPAPASGRPGGRHAARLAPFAPLTAGPHRRPDFICEIEFPKRPSESDFPPSRKVGISQNLGFPRPKRSREGRFLRKIHFAGRLSAERRTLITERSPSGRHVAAGMGGGRRCAVRRLTRRFAIGDPEGIESRDPGLGAAARGADADAQPRGAGVHVHIVDALHRQ